MAINEKKAYAAYYDNDIRMKSSSGAIFSLLANEVLEKKKNCLWSCNECILHRS